MVGFHLYERSRMDKLVETENRLVVEGIWCETLKECEGLGKEGGPRRRKI